MAERRLLVRWLERSSIASLEKWLCCFEDLICIHPQRDVNPHQLIQIFERSGLSRQHSVTILSTGYGESAGRLAGLHHRNGKWIPVNALSIVGSGLPSWQLSSEQKPQEDNLDDTVPERWSRTAGAIGSDTWRRLSRSQVAIIGCGRSGSAAAESLALMGVRKLLLIDEDRIEQSNLDAMHSVQEADVGRYKVEAVANRLSQIRSDLAVTAVKASVTAQHAWKRLKEYDLIVTTADRDEARWIAARVASLYLIAHLDIGTGIVEVDSERVMGADVRLMLPGEACLLCAGGLRRLKDATYNLHGPSESLQRGVALDWHEQRSGSLLTVNSTAIGMGLQFWLDLLSGRLRGSKWLRLQWSAAGEPRIEPQPLESNKECSICQQRGLGDLAIGV